MECLLSCYFDQFLELMYFYLSLADLCCAHQVNRGMREAAHPYLQRLLPLMQPLYSNPFCLTTSQIIGATELDLQKARLRENSMTALSSALVIGAMPNLRTLLLCMNTKIGDSGVIVLSNAFAKGALSALEWLDLSATSMWQSLPILLDGMKELKHLRALLLDENELYEDSIAALSHSPILAQLEASFLPLPYLLPPPSALNSHPVVNSGSWIE